MPTLPLTRSDVETYLGVTAGPGEQTWLDAAAAAASVFAARHGAGVELVDGDPLDVPADVRLGAVMLAGRWFQRRNSITGVASFGDFGPAYVRSRDPDVSQLLGLDRPGVA